MDTAARFSKAIESIAALKLHNYAMRRREQMSQKMKVILPTVSKVMYI